MTYAVMMQAIGLVFDPYVLLVIFCSALFGLFVGCIPGLTATMATALLVPITFFMPPVPAVAAIVTATAMAIFSVTFQARCCEYLARLLPRLTPTSPIR